MDVGITARNYSVGVERGIISIQNKLRKAPTLHGVEYHGETSLDSSLDLESLRMFQSLNKLSVKFALPDGGRIFDQSLAGIKGMKIRLPYSSISIEYYWPEQKLQVCLLASKMTDKIEPIIAARLQSTERLDPDSILISMAVATSSYPDFWTIYPYSYLLDSDWQLEPGNSTEVDIDTWGIEIADGGVADFSSPYAGIPVGMFPYMFRARKLDRRFDLKVNGADLVRACVENVHNQIPVVLELIEALNCKNVATEPLEKVSKVINERRKKQGLPPLYETKTLMIIPTEEETRRAEALGGHHASPRQHLRRGHPRKLASGITVWVNDTVVGDPSRGKIVKDYAIVAAED
jgi:hypothetical protein